MDTTDDEFEEEEFIVYANFEEGTVDRDIFQNCDLRFKVIGLDSDTPIVQLGDQTFKGTWTDTIGTKVFLEEDTSPEQVDPVFTVLPPKMLKYKCMSTKTLELSRIFLKLKNGEQTNNDSQNTNNIDMSPEETREEELMTLAQSTANPDSDTNEIMDEIVAEAILGIAE